MKIIFGFCILALFGCIKPVKAAAPEIRVEVSAPSYLYFSWWVRMSDNQNGEGAVQKQANQVEYRQFLHDSALQLYKKGFLSEQSYLLAKTFLANSQLDLENTKDYARRTIETYRSFVTQRSFSAGAGVKLEDLHQIYMNVWALQCQEAEREIKNTKNIQELRSFLHEKNIQLHEKGTISLKSLLTSELNLKNADASVKAAQEWSKQCRAGIPTLEMLYTIGKSSSALAQIPEAPKQIVAVGPSGYLTFYDFGRSMRVSRDEKRIALARQRKKSAFFAGDFKRQEQVYRSGNLSEKVYRESKLAAETSLDQIAILENEVKFYEASQKINQLQMQFAEGKPASLREMYDEHVKYWDADCAEKEKSAVKLRREAEHNNWIERLYFQLRDSNAESQNRYAIALVTKKDSTVDLERAQNKSELCRDDIPAFEYLEKIRRPSSNLSAFENEVKVPNNAPSYLNTFWFAHEKTQSVIESLRRLEEQKALTAAKKQFLEMDENLFKKGHLTRVKYLESNLDYETADIKLNQEKYNKEAARFDMESAFLRLSWISGVKPDLKELYRLMSNLYKNQCESQQLDIAFAQKHTDYQEILFKNAEDLKKRGEESVKVYEMRKSEFEMWKAELALRKEIYAGCATDIPTLEYLSNIKSVLPE